MNKFKTYIILVAAVFAVYSCDSILDTEPQQSISEDLALNNSDNVKAVLVGAYNEFSDADVWGGLMQMQPDLLADEGDVNWTGTYEQPRQIFLKEIQVDNSFVADAWVDSYSTINTVNNVLSAIDVVNAGDQDRVRGEALFIRGSLYFELARQFGKAWNDGDPSSNLAVPLVTTPTTSINEESEIPRNTVQEIYNQAISDLTEAKNLLPPTNSVYATTYAASAMLARIYLQQGDYANAAAEANRVIESGEFTLVPNYADVFNNSNANTSEDIFAIQVTSQDGGNSLHTFYASQGNGGRGDIEIQQQHLDKYESGDDRLDLFYADGEGTRSGKWQDQYGNVLVIRLAEMYLIRAESNFRTGTQVGPNTPGQDLTIIRERVNLGPNLTPTLQDILDERYVELAFEGHFLHDKKRLEQDVGSLSWNSPDLVYPVPLREINANDALTQNDGYGGSN
ncbi:MAG: RagB/SusD family nutrient uptake outer membrane protein [Balneolaceae bacterium]|nr:RagB/SusD family nutrient uptake outer membrane protein [Balneolaceae bacterium]